MTLTHRRLGVQQIFSAPSAYPRASFPARGKNSKKLFWRTPPKMGRFLGGRGPFPERQGRFGRFGGAKNEKTALF